MRGKEEAGNFGEVAPAGMGAPERAGGLAHTRAHTAAYVGVCISANAHGICHWDHGLASEGLMEAQGPSDHRG